jgi:hypothetical protein
VTKNDIDESSGIRIPTIPYSVLFLPLITGIVTIVGWYYLTNARLDRYGDEINTMNARINTAAKSISEAAAEDLAAREKIRDDLAAVTKIGRDNLISLDKRQAITDEKLSRIQSSLDKLLEQSQSKSK